MAAKTLLTVVSRNYGSTKRYSRRKSARSASRQRFFRRLGLETLETRNLLSGPEIEVLDGSWDVPDGTGAVDFGPVALGSPVTRSLLVKDTGTANLTLTEPISVPAGFTVVSWEFTDR
jgi:hypothetical protein